MDLEEKIKKEEQEEQQKKQQQRKEGEQEEDRKSRRRKVDQNEGFGVDDTKEELETRLIEMTTTGTN